MIRSLSRLSTLKYRLVAKPILFVLPPDFTHQVTVVCSAFAGHIPPVRWLIKSLWSYNNRSKLSQTFKGIKFANPVGLSAGFDKNFRLLNFLPALGFGFAECGSMSNNPSKGNPRPHYYRLKKSGSIVVNAGLNNQGSEILIQRINNWQNKRRDWIPLNISVAKTNSHQSSTVELGVNDYTECLKKLKQANVGDMITINISCPNAHGGEPFTTPERLERLLKEVDKIGFSKPIFLKMPSDKSWPKFKKLIDVALKHKVAGLTICNLNKNRKSIGLEYDFDDEIKGSLSGKPVYDLSNELVSKTYEYCGNKLIIIGVGGIFSAHDAYEKIKRGATLVELITGMIFEGPQLVGQINAGLVDLLVADGFTNISQAIGAYHRKP